MYRFTLPRDLYHGKDALSSLKNLSGKKAVVVVGGGSMKRFGFLDKAVDYLKEAGMEVKLIEGVEPDPSVETVMKGAAVMREFEPDWIVAMGGGSPIDAAKAMWVFYEYPNTTFEEIITPFSFPTLRTKAKFCAIPSTSGTATEVTAFSVITDYAKGIKYPLADFNITPDVAIVDPALAETMPAKLTAHTGMDAMTHAIEAYVSTLNCEYTDPLALHAIELIHDNLKKSYEGDMACRDKMVHITKIWKREMQCTMHSVLQVWHSQMLCSVSFTQWLTRQVRLSQAVTLFTAVQTLCIFLRLSSITQKILLQLSVMLRLLSSSTSRAKQQKNLLTHSSLNSVQ